MVPVHENGIHWCLLVVHIPKRQILYCDRYALMEFQHHRQMQILFAACIMRCQGVTGLNATESMSFKCLTCSVFDHAEYYDEKRTHHMVKALFMWLVLEAFDKCCEERILGDRQCSGIPMAMKEPGPSFKHSTATHSMENINSAAIDVNESETSYLC